MAIFLVKPAQLEVGHIIMSFYNSRRLQSALGYTSPTEIERKAA